MLFVGTSIIHPSTEGVFLLCNILDLLIYSMNPQYFCRFFKTHFHTTPISYINQYRVTQAADLLTGSSLSILEIALHTGFESPSYFASIFRRTFGMSPEEYRKAMP